MYILTKKSQYIRLEYEKTPFPVVFHEVAQQVRTSSQRPILGKQHAVQRRGEHEWGIFPTFAVHNLFLNVKYYPLPQLPVRSNLRK